jgi:hypothetical protein
MAASPFDRDPANRWNTTRPKSAMESSDAVRETALLMPEATPARSCGTEVMTAVVRGATVPDIPNPSTTIPGKNVVQ